jgi:hypothetical protein
VKIRARLDEFMGIEPKPESNAASPFLDFPGKAH